MINDSIIKDHFEEILNILPDAIVFVDKKSVVRFVNKRYLKLRRISRENIIGKDIRKLRTGESLSKVLSTGTPIRNLHKKTGDDEYIVTVLPVWDRNQSIIGAISISIDLKQARQIAQQIKYSGVVHEDADGYALDKMAKFKDIITKNAIFLNTIEKAKKIAQKDVTVLILGESGTGKELLAQSIHTGSPRYQKQFVAINCAAIPEQLLESELFGYAPGSFTGSLKRGKLGLFEVAEGGTLFLDEIGDMSIHAQAKLLRILEDHKMRRVGDTQEVEIDVRIIAATNKNLKELIKRSCFREDIFYRISEIPLIIQPLKDRKEDIEPLVTHFILKYNKKHNTNFFVASDVIDALVKYDWPGNVREMQNALQYAINTASFDLITKNDLPHYINEKIPSEIQEGMKKLRDINKEIQKEKIMEALMIYGNSTTSKKKVAKIFGIGLSTLYKKIKET